MAQFTLPKTWVSGEVLYAADLNAQFAATLAGFTPSQIDGASANVSAMQATVDPYPASVASLASNLLGELQRLRYQMNLVVGRTNWYEDPSTSLELAAPVVSKVDYAVTTDGSNPGLGGMCITNVNVALSAMGSGVISAPTTIATLTVDKGARPYNIKFLQDANDGTFTTEAGLLVTAVFTTASPGVFTGTARFDLVKDSVAIREMTFPVQFNVPRVATQTGTFTFGATGATSLSFIPGNDVGGIGQGSMDVDNTGSMTFFPAFSGTLYYNLPLTCLDLLDISAADTGVVYELVFTFANITLPTGTVSTNVDMNGLLIGKEYI